MSDERCQLCGSDEVFRTKLWWRACLECGSSHVVCVHCLHEWDLRLVSPVTQSGRLRHQNCPDGAAVARELMGGLA